MYKVHSRDLVPITWEVFRIELKKKYIPNVIWDRKANEFLQLVQGQMSVSEYKPSSLSCSGIRLRLSISRRRKLESFKRVRDGFGY